MRPCPSCRRPREDDAVFCPHCGHSRPAAERRRAERRRRYRRRLLVLAGCVALAGAGLALWSARRPAERPLPASLDVPAARAALAEADWSRAIHLLSPEGGVPATAGARALLAEALHRRCAAEGGRGFERAARVRELSLADDPDDVLALRARAELESDFGEPGRASSWWDEALERSRSGGPAAAAERGDLLLDAAVARALAGEAVRAEVLLEELLRADPAHARALANRGMLHLAAGRLRLAEADLGAAMSADPSLAAGHIGLVETRRRLGARASSAALPPPGLDEGCAAVMGHLVRAFLAEEEGARATAEEQVRAALRLAPDEPRLHAEWERLAGP